MSPSHLIVEIYLIMRTAEGCKVNIDTEKRAA